MTAALDQLLKRHADRRDVEASAAKLKFTPVMITDEKALNEFIAQTKEVKKNFLNKSFLVTQDMQVLISAATDACDQAKINLPELIATHWAKLSNTLDESSKNVLWARDQEEAKKREDEAKARGEVPGQLKIGKVGKNGKVKDDGSTAEAAGECKTDKLTADNDPANAVSPKELMGEKAPEGKESPKSPTADAKPAGKHTAPASATEKTAVQKAFEKAKQEGLVADADPKPAGAKDKTTAAKSKDADSSAAPARANSASGK